MTTKYFKANPGFTTGNVVISDANVTLGNISNIHISGGSAGQTIQTDGAGNLTFGGGSPAPMPTVISTGTTVLIPDEYQGLFAYPVTVDGTLNIEGIMIDVSGQGPAGTVGQIQYNGNADFGATNGFTFDESSGNLNVPGNVNTSGFLKLNSYSRSALNAITGVLGQIAVVTDSTPNGGMPAYWDTTNMRWSYVFDNSAV